MNEKTEGANLSLRSRDSPKKKKSLRSRLFSKKKKKKTNYLVCLLPNIYIYIYYSIFHSSSQAIVYTIIFNVS